MQTKTYDNRNTKDQKREMELYCQIFMLLESKYTKSKIYIINHRVTIITQVIENKVIKQNQLLYSKQSGKVEKMTYVTNRKQKTRLQI